MVADPRDGGGSCRWWCQHTGGASKLVIDIEDYDHRI